MQARLERAAREGISVPLDGRRLLLPSPLLSDIVVEVDGSRARALFRIEGDGAAGDVHVGYVGGEEVALAAGRSGWEPEGGAWLPHLEGVLAALERRRGAASARDAVALAGLAFEAGPVAPAALPAETLPLRAYFIRVEGDRATVSEVDGPTGKSVTRRMELRRVEDGWRFSSGLL